MTLKFSVIYFNTCFKDIKIYFYKYCNIHVWDITIISILSVMKRFNIETPIQDATRRFLFKIDLKRQLLNCRWEILMWVLNYEINF